MDSELAVIYFRTIKNIMSMALVSGNGCGTSNVRRKTLSESYF